MAHKTTQSSATFSTQHLIAASILTAMQLFFVAMLFGTLNTYYASIMLFNAILLPILMGLKKPWRIQNLIPLFSQLFIVGFIGFMLSGLLAIVFPSSFIEAHPLFLEALSTLVAVSATLPASMFPFSISLFLLAVLFKSSNGQTTKQP